MERPAGLGSRCATTTTLADWSAASRLNKALQLTRRRRSACRALQPAGRRVRGGFAGRPPVGSWYTHAAGS